MGAYPRSTGNLLGGIVAGYNAVRKLDMGGKETKLFCIQVR